MGGGPSKEPEPVPTRAVMDSSTTNQSSGFHVLELHGGTLQTGIQLGIAAILVAIGAKWLVSHHRKRKAAKETLKQQQLPLFNRRERPGDEIREEFDRVIVPHIFSQRENISKMLKFQSSPEQPRRERRHWAAEPIQRPHGLDS